MAITNKKVDELSLLYLQYNPLYADFLDAVNSPVEESERKALSAQDPVFSRLELSKNLVLVVNRCFTPSLREGIDSCRDFNRWSWSDLGQAGGAKYYKEKAPLLMQQIDKINRLAGLLVNLHEKMTSKAEGLCSDELVLAKAQGDKLDAEVRIENAEFAIRQRTSVPAAIIKLKEEISELKASWDKEFEVLKQVKKRALLQAPALGQEITVAAPQLHQSEVNLLRQFLLSIQGFSANLPSSRKMPTSRKMPNLIFPNQSISRGLQLLAEIRDQAETSYRRLDEFSSSLERAETELRRLEKICPDFGSFAGTERKG